MWKEVSKSRGLRKGDLVYHVLYGREWVGVLLEIVDIYQDRNSSSTRNELAVVRMQPGSNFEFFFRDMVSKKNRITDSMGMVSINWLFRLEERKR